MLDGKDFGKIENKQYYGARTIKEDDLIRVVNND